MIYSQTRMRGGDVSRVCNRRRNLGADFAGQLNDKEEHVVSEIKAPMAGKIIDIKVNVGDSISEGDEVVILEAMKMELPIVAEEAGTVKEVHCKKGDGVEGDSVLIVLE